MTLFNFLPLTLEQIDDVFGKGLKQRKTKILLGLLSLISFCLGHASVKVHDFWNEPIILWMAIFYQQVCGLNLRTKQKVSSYEVNSSRAS